MLGAAGTAGRWPGGDRSFAARVPGAAWRGRALAACCLETKMRQPDTAAQPAQGCWLPGLAAGGGAVQPPWLRNGVNKPAGPRHHHQPSQGWRVSPRIFPSSDHRRSSRGQTNIYFSKKVIDKIDVIKNKIKSYFKVAHSKNIK